MSIAGVVRAVVREKRKATGMEWRRLHRAETLLMLADGKLKPMLRGEKRKRHRKPKEAPAVK